MHSAVNEMPIFTYRMIYDGKSSRNCFKKLSDLIDKPKKSVISKLTILFLIDPR